MLKIYPHNPNHDKNMRYLFSEDSKIDWFKKAYPDLTESDCIRYLDTELCDICATKWDIDNVKKCHIINKKMKGVVCQRCHEIIGLSHDMEHLQQILTYLKEEGNNGKKRRS